MVERKDILHVIVGAGFPLAFCNAVQSVLRHTSDDVLAIYNFVDARDRSDLDTLHLDEFGERLTVLAQENAADHYKIGALFSAYNRALAFASDRYRYISLIQGDMQMVKATPNRIEILDSIFSSDSARVFLVNTVAGGGSLHDGVFDDAWTGEVAPKFNSSMGSNSIGVLNLDLVASENFRFERDEGSTAEKMRKRGFVIVTVGSLVDLAFNPWPGTVRNGIRKGHDVPFENPAGILKLIQRGPEEEPLQIGQRKVRNIVVPNGFRTLYPYWASDLEKTKWIPRRYEATKQLGIGFFSAIDDEGQISSYLSPRGLKRSPSLGYVLKRLFRGMFLLNLERVRTIADAYARKYFPVRPPREEEHGQ